MMNLFIVTYEGDFTQFIINATDHDNPEQYAIQRAMKVNLLPDLGTFNEEDIEEAKDSSMYELTKVDMQTLANKIRGNAIDGVYGGLFGDTIVIHN